MRRQGQLQTQPHIFSQGAVRGALDTEPGFIPAHLMEAVARRLRAIHAHMQHCAPPSEPLSLEGGTSAFKSQETLDFAVLSLALWAQYRQQKACNHALLRRFRDMEKRQAIYSVRADLILKLLPLVVKLAKSMEKKLVLSSAQSAQLAKKTAQATIPAEQPAQFSQAFLTHKAAIASIPKFSLSASLHDKCLAFVRQLQEAVIKDSLGGAIIRVVKKNVSSIFITGLIFTLTLMIILCFYLQFYYDPI